YRARTCTACRPVAVPRLLPSRRLRAPCFVRLRALSSLRFVFALPTVVATAVRSVCSTHRPQCPRHRYTTSSIPSLVQYLYGCPPRPVPFVTCRRPPPLVVRFRRRLRPRPDL